jgi:hypothetical protein
MRNKYSVTSIKDKNGTIKTQYESSGGINYNVNYPMKRKRIEDAHRDIMERNPGIKRLTTKVLELKK